MHAITPLARIRGLCAGIQGQPLLDRLDLDLYPGKVHVIMGPNGAGKSSLANIIAGHPRYIVSAGAIELDGQDLLAMTPDQRALAGVFLGMQHPIEIPGVNTAYFLRSAVNARRRALGLEELDAYDFLAQVRSHLDTLKFDQRFLSRAVNEGFSGGERKRHEMLQMLLLEPRLAILDEPDSGLDVDALQVVADAINRMRDAKRAILLVTHYHRLLDLVRPDHVHVLAHGRIVASGNATLARTIETAGYDSYLAPEAIA